MLRKFFPTFVRLSHSFDIASPVHFVPLVSTNHRASFARMKICAVPANNAIHIHDASVLQVVFRRLSTSAKASSDSPHSAPSTGSSIATTKSATYRGSTSSGVVWEYEGEVDKRGRKDGVGTCSWDNGDTYRGQWKCDEKHGTGMYQWPGGKIYDGEWKNDQAEGFGKMIYPDGAVYEGAWEEGVRCGYGVAKWPSGMLYEGEWQAGKRNGLGKLTAPDGSVYSGQWRDGGSHGNGEMAFPGGKVDRGVWQLGKKL